MAEASPLIVAEWTETACADTSFIRLKDFLPHVLRRYYKDASDEYLAELAEVQEAPVAKCLQERIANALNDGVKVAFELSTEKTEYYIRALASPEASLLKKLRISSPEAFEHFCSKVVVRLGGVSQVVGGSGDGGIDFFGYGLGVGDDTGPRPPPSYAILIGQAKRYTKTATIGENDIRTFVGGALLKAADIRLQYADRIGLLSPVQLVFWGTSSFSPNARTYARRMGIWFLGGMGFSQLALRCGLQESDVDEAESVVREAAAARRLSLNETSRKQGSKEPASS